MSLHLQGAAGPWSPCDPEGVTHVEHRAIKALHSPRPRPVCELTSLGATPGAFEMVAWPDSLILRTTHRIMKRASPALLPTWMATIRDLTSEGDDQKPTKRRSPSAPWRSESTHMSERKHRFPWTVMTVLDDATEEYNTTQLRQMLLSRTTRRVDGDIPDADSQYRPWPGGEVDPPVTHLHQAHTVGPYDCNIDNEM